MGPPSGAAGRLPAAGVPLDSVACLIKFRVVGGPDAGLEVRMDSEPVSIGRDSGCDVVLTDPTVSRSHMKLERIDGRWYLQHLAPGNQTHVNGRPVIVTDPPTALKCGDRISFGASVMVVEFRHTGLTDASRDPGIAADAVDGIPLDASIKLGAPPALRPPEIEPATRMPSATLRRLAAPVAALTLALLFLAAILLRSCG